MSEKVTSSTATSENVFFQEHRVTRNKRANSLGNGNFRGCTIWFTGLSGAGKSTISFGVEDYLVRRGIHAYALDGDNLRHGLNSNLGFSSEDREENIRRTSQVAKLFADSGLICLSSFISPFRKDRDNARLIHEKENLPFFECFVDTPLEVCEKRDTKGLYARARSGQIKGFTGIDQPYEEPHKPDLILRASEFTADECIEQVIKLLVDRNLIPPEVLDDVKELFILPELCQEKLSQATSLPSLDINTVDLQWVQVLSEGWASPLTGFMREEQYLKCLNFGYVTDSRGVKHNQSIPIVLAVTSQDKERLEKSSAIALKYNDKIIAILNNPEFYSHLKEERVCKVWGTSNPGHPVVKMILDSGDFLVGGELNVFQKIKWNDGLDQFRLTPNEIRAKLKEMKADAAFAFQLRNPIHNGHALLMKDTKRILKEKHNFKCPVLLLHPLGGWTKSDDVPLDVRMKQHQAILSHSSTETGLDPETTLLAIFPSPMSYAGPREVQWHAKARVATGATFYIVGRDPAGIQHPQENRPLYHPDHGREVLKNAPGLEMLHIIDFKVAAYDVKAKQMAFRDSSRPDDFIEISGTKMRQFARDGVQPPEGFMHPAAWAVLAEFYRKQKA